MSSADCYTTVLLQEIRGQNEAILKVISQLQDKMKTLATRDALQAVADNVEVIKSVLTEG